MNLINLKNHDETACHDVVNMLTSMLAEAREGRLTGLVVLKQFRDQNSIEWDCNISDYKIAEVVFALERMKAGIVRSAFDD